MSTLILIHGGWHGPWCWERIRPLLQSSGYRVETPSLTGMGDRAHLLDETISLETHVLDVVNHVMAYDFDDVVLFAHSYAGIVATVAAARLGARVRGIIYCDAFVPDPSRSLMDYLSPQERNGIRAQAQPWRLAPRDPSFYGIEDPTDQAYARRKLCDWNIRCLEAKAEFHEGDLDRVARAYVAGEAQRPGGRFEQFMQRFERHAELGPVYRIDAGHDFFFTHPVAAAEICKAELSRIAAVGSGSSRRHGGTA
ncbi:MAG: alpha/beta hydrolase [Steroidobacteraceae bacterium]